MKGWAILAVISAASLAVGAISMAAWRSRPAQVIDAYHIWYHKNGHTTYNNTRWLGSETQQCPLDMWIYQEILSEVKPDVLIETGTYQGGGAYYYASIFDLLQHGRVITIDLQDFARKPKHARITYLLGSSTSEEIVAKVKSLIQPGERVLVTLDSDHHKAHVVNELRHYSPLVSVDSYLIVQDTHFNGHPILSKFGPGPYEAVQEFLQSHADFQPDRSREKFGMTFNPGGFLKRVRAGR